MAQKYATINIKPIIYENNSDGQYELNTNGEKIIVEECETVNGKKCNNIVMSDNFDYLITITENI